MDSFEWNKVAMAVLVAGVTAMSISLVVNSFYDGAPKHDAHHGEVKRGYQIEVTEEAAGSGAAEAAKPVDIAAFFSGASAEKGAQLTKACAACHSFEEGGANKVGPNLYGIVGAKTAHKSDYSYSNALASLNKTWDYQALSEFLEKPRNYVAGTKMAFAGMKKPEDRASTLLYLRSLSKSPLPLPEVKSAETEKAPDITPAEVKEDLKKIQKTKESTQKSDKKATEDAEGQKK